MPGGIAPIDFWAVFNAAAESARARRLDEQNRERQERQDKLHLEDFNMRKTAFELENKAKTAAAEAEARRRKSLTDLMATQAKTPEEQAYAAADPEGFSTYRKGVVDQEQAAATQQQSADRFKFDQEKAAADLAAKEQEATQKRASRTARVKLEASRMIAGNPSLAPQAQSHIQRLADAGQIDWFQLPGHAIPEGLAGPQMAPTIGEAGQMQSQAIAEGAPVEGVDAKLVSEDRVLGSPEARRRAIALNEKGGGMTINMPGAP
jgi:hypothetical protein